MRSLILVALGLLGALNVPKPQNPEAAPWLGIRLDEGVISYVFVGSPAARGGLRVGDEVLSADGKSPRRTEDLAFLRQKRPRDVVAFAIRRDKETFNLKVELGSQRELLSVDDLRNWPGQGAHLAAFDGAADPLKDDPAVAPVAPIARLAARYVDLEKGSDEWTGTRAEKGGVGEGPWRTLEKANAELRAGQRLFLASGAYGRIRPSASGSAEVGPLVYQAVPGAQVVITGGAHLDGRAHIAIAGCRFESGTTWVRMDDHSRDIRLVGNAFNSTVKSHFEGIALRGSRLTLRRNHFGMWLGDTIRAEGASHILIEENDFSQCAATHGVVMITATEVVVRRNSFRNPWSRVLNIRWLGDKPARNVLVEDNVFWDCDWDGTSPNPARIDQRGSSETVLFDATRGIFRNNLLLGRNAGNRVPWSGTLNFQAYPDLHFKVPVNHFETLRIYHNTLAFNRGNAVAFGITTPEAHMQDNRFLNNVITQTADAALYTAQQSIPWQDWIFRSNLIYGPREDAVLNLQTGRERVTSVARAQALAPGTFTETVTSRPKFADARFFDRAEKEPQRISGRDLPGFFKAFALAEGSPGKGAASPLTKVTKEARGEASLAVADAYAFCDGFGLIPPDRIRIGEKTEVRIRRVADGHTLELEAPVRAPAGAPVYFAPCGPKPDLGTYALPAPATKPKR